MEEDVYMENKERPDAFSFLSQSKALQLCGMGKTSGKVLAGARPAVTCQCDHREVDEDMVRVLKLQAMVRH